MANYDEFMKKAKDALDTIADVSVEAYKHAEEKARVFARKAKLNAGIANERAVIRRLKVELGGTYYKLYKDAPVEDLKPLCEEITDALDRIADRQRELEELRNCTTYQEDDEDCGCGCEAECEVPQEPVNEPEPCCAPEDEPCCAPKVEPEVEPEPEKQEDE